MVGSLRIARTVAGILLIVALFSVALPGSVAAAGWSGRYSVFTKGSFSYQHTDYTCVGASVQMMLNIINGTAKHSAAAQKTYWSYGRDHNRYGTANNGVDPVGWVAALEHFGAGDYAVYRSAGFQAGLKALATEMEATDRPVGLFVDRGAHAWVMTGFESSADPAMGGSFRVTALQVMGPLYPDGTINGHPYDPAPGTWLNADKLRIKFTPMSWPRATEWDGRWIAVVPS